MSLLKNQQSVSFRLKHNTRFTSFTRTIRRRGAQFASTFRKVLAYSNDKDYLSGELLSQNMA
jgi:hypothetical protein